MTDDLHAASAAGRGPSAINFPAFVLSLVHTAAVHFGDVADPATGEMYPPNLALGLQMIDILAMLEEKTRGNLSAEERQLVDQVLYELRLRYAELSGAGEADSAPRIIIP